MPNFCKNTSIFIIVITAILIAAIVTLLTEASLLNFSLTSFYIVWLFTLWAGCLCVTGKVSTLPIKQYISAFSICLVVFVAFEVLIQVLYLGEINTDRLVKYALVAALFIALALRAFQLSGIYSERSRNALHNKLTALQARIEPHFLFNSLNSIAELTHIDPEKAELAIESLSAVLRSNLKNDKAFHSLNEEIELCTQYIQLEKYRLDKKLTCNWDVQESALSSIVPKLLLQPLIENSILHGISPFVHGGEIRIVITSDKRLKISIYNTPSSDNYISERIITSKNTGHGIAIENTRERLFVIYDDNYRIKAKQSQNSYKVTIEIPKTPPKNIAVN